MKFKWTKSEEDFLINNLNEMSYNEISRQLNKSETAIRYKCKLMGIERDPVINRKIIEMSQFPKEHRPWNKGMKGLHFSPKTEFKKGHKPHNTKHNGCITTRIHKRTGVPYKYIRISESEWQLYHRYIWERQNGLIPASHIVGFKDGNTLNCSIGNLYCMSRADNVRRNHNIKKAAESMRKTWASKIREEFKMFPKLAELKLMQLELRRIINETQ